ncbi:hypothetical protein RJ641_004995 [Dillenia turbinata]|uniref:Uncharacterized protein n=1 Tax=Dillenia turbinata TaxID=194707 RepID=A0AAN8V748_9MAGN
MSFVVETIVGAAIELLINKLMSSELLNFAREEQLQTAVRKWIRSLIPAWFTSFAPRNLEFHSNMKSEFEEITARFEQLLKQKGDLAPNVHVSRRPNKKQKRFPTTSLVEERSLKELEIQSYGGLSFPSWIGDRSFSGLVDLRLDGCKKCKKLPGLGQLPSLKNLIIQSMDEVESVGWEFCSSHADASHSSQSSPFPSLESLHFQKMTKWVDWSFPDASFAKLMRLEIHECPLLVFPLSRLNATASHLQRLELDGCSDAIFRDGNIELASLKYLIIGGISGLSSLPDEFLFPNVEGLCVRNCSELKRLSNSLHMLASLKNLSIWSCAKLVNLELPSMPRILHIQDCEASRCVTEGSNSTCSLALSGLGLQYLSIFGCPSLTSISGNQWFRNIENLKIEDCESLESFTSRQLPTTLKSLRISNCPKLESVWNCEGIETFPDTGLPTPNLQRLSILDCPNLKSLPNNIQDLTSLRFLRISNCPLLDLRLPPNLQSFDIIGPSEALIDQFLVLPPSLTSLTIENLSNLESTSFPSLLNLTSLSELKISNCPRLQHLRHLNFTSLEVLRIYFCEKLRILPETGLPPTLLSLRVLGCPRLTPKLLNSKKGKKQLALIPDVMIDGHRL